MFMTMAWGAYLMLSAFDKNISFYVTPSEIMDYSSSRQMRLGGLVLEKSVVRASNGLDVTFVVHDCVRRVPVSYYGLLPDLLQEGRGIVVIGTFKDGVFVAREVLAKHDENYTPPKVLGSTAHLTVEH